MKILIATEYFPESETGEITGGVESRAFYAAKELAKRHKVSILTSRRPGSKRRDSFLGISIIRMGPEYPYTQSGHLLKRILFSINAALYSRRIVTKGDIEIIDGYSFFTYPSALFASFFTKASGFLTYHEVWIGNWSKNTGTKKGFMGEVFEKALLLKARILGNPFISVSEFTKAKLVGQGISPSKIRVVSNGVTLSDYSKIKIKKDSRPTICYVGRLTKNKHVEDLIAAASVLKSRINRLKIIIVGSGPEEEGLKKLAKEQGLDRTIEFTGYLKSHRDVLKLLKSSSVFCSPSIVEGFGITLIESLASGIPYVCSDIPPFKEISENGKGGLLFKHNDPADLSKKLERLLTDKALYKRCSEEGKKLSQKYDWKEIALRIEKAYSEGRSGKK